MQKIFNLLIVATLLTSLTACHRGYTVYGELPVEEMNGSKVYLRNIADGSMLDSTTIQDGKFEFTGKTEQPCMVSVFAASATTRYMSNIVLEKGKIHINVFNDSLYGTPLNDLYYNSFTADTASARLEGVLRDLSAKYYTCTTPDEQVAVAAEYSVAMSAYEAYKLEQLEKKLGIAFKPVKGGDKPAPSKKKPSVKQGTGSGQKKTANKSKKHTNRQGKRKATAK